MKNHLRKSPAALAGCFATLIAAAILPTAKGAVIFSEDFEGPDASGGPVNVTTSNTSFDEIRLGSTTSPNISQVVADDQLDPTFPPSGGGANNYLLIRDGVTNNVPRLTAATAVPAGSVFQLSFDFREPYSLGGDADMRLGLSTTSANSGGDRTLEAQFQNGTLRFRGGGDSQFAYTSTATHRVEIVGNFGASPLEYGVKTVDPGEYDVWIDGVLEMAGLPFAGGNNHASHFHIAGGSNGSLGEVWLDNIVLLNEVTLSPVPEPSTVALVGLSLVGIATLRLQRRK